MRVGFREVGEWSKHLGLSQVAGLLALVVACRFVWLLLPAMTGQNEDEVNVANLSVPVTDGSALAVAQEEDVAARRERVLRAIERAVSANLAEWPGAAERNIKCDGPGDPQPGWCQLTVLPKASGLRTVEWKEGDPSVLSLDLEKLGTVEMVNCEVFGGKLIREWYWASAESSVHHCALPEGLSGRVHQAQVKRNRNGDTWVSLFSDSYAEQNEEFRNHLEFGGHPGDGRHLLRILMAREVAKEFKGDSYATGPDHTVLVPGREPGDCLLKLVGMGADEEFMSSFRKLGFKELRCPDQTLTF